MACKSCGKCCENISFNVSAETADVEFIKLHGFEVEERGDMLRVLVNIPCQMLKGGKCTIYENRPELCRQHKCVENLLDDYPELKGEKLC